MPKFHILFQCKVDAHRVDQDAVAAQISESLSRQPTDYHRCHDYMMTFEYRMKFADKFKAARFASSIKPELEALLAPYGASVSSLHIYDDLR